MRAEAGVYAVEEISEIARVAADSSYACSAGGLVLSVYVHSLAHETLDGGKSPLLLRYEHCRSKWHARSYSGPRPLPFRGKPRMLLHRSRRYAYVTPARAAGGSRLKRPLPADPPR